MIFEDCSPDAMTEFFEPPTKWANLADCGDFPCTGPKNTIFSFKNTQWTATGENSVPAGVLSDFNLVPDVVGYTEHFPSCEK
jgi:hypothetical protein